MICPLPMGGLARIAHMDLGMAARQVNALVEAKLVTRQPDPADRRVSLVAATTDGQRVAGSLKDVRRRHLERALAGWSTTELQDFDRQRLMALGGRQAGPHVSTVQPEPATIGSRYLRTYARVSSIVASLMLVCGVTMNDRVRRVCSSATVRRWRSCAAVVRFVP